MGMRRVDIPITRDHVSEWLAEYEETLKTAPSTVLRDFLQTKISAQQLESETVITVGSDNLRDETPLIDLLMSDLSSYGFQE